MIRSKWLWACAFVMTAVSLGTPGYLSAFQPEPDAALAKDVADYSKECRKRIEKGDSGGDNYFRLMMGQLAVNAPKEVARYTRLIEEKGSLIGGTYSDFLNVRRTDGTRFNFDYSIYLRNLPVDAKAEFYIMMALDPDKAMADRGKKALSAMGSDAAPSLITVLRLPSVYLYKDRVAALKPNLLATGKAGLEAAEAYRGVVEVEIERVERDIKGRLRDGLGVGQANLVRSAYLGAQRKLIAEVIAEMKSK